MIRIVDYGLGNVQAFLTMFKRLGFEAARAKTVSDLAQASKIILPGVGAFDHAVDLLNQSGMREPLEARVLGDNVPLLGVCVGMQLLASRSDEGSKPGLGWIPGRVRSFRSVEAAQLLPQPHMGWNSVTVSKTEAIFAHMEDPRFYFLHSYFFDCDHFGNAIAHSCYGLDFACSVRSGNVYGVQFHPEKSHHFGAQLLKNFAEL